MSETVKVQSRTLREAAQLTKDMAADDLREVVSGMCDVLDQRTQLIVDLIALVETVNTERCAQRDALAVIAKAADEAERSRQAGLHDNAQKLLRSARTHLQTVNAIEPAAVAWPAGLEGFERTGTLRSSLKC